MDQTTNGGNIFKILLLGDSNVGKTCIVQRFCDDSFIDGYISTIGMNELEKKEPNQHFLLKESILNKNILKLMKHKLSFSYG